MKGVEMSIKMGETGKDKITGFVGVATGYCEYITGCNQFLLSPPVNKKGERVEPQWFDEQRLERVGKLTVRLDSGTSSGFDKPAPKR
jgi:hypothetical protein